MAWLTVCAPFDAVNVRQMGTMDQRLSAGIASNMAVANIPQVEQDMTFAVGAGVGHYNGQTALAIGGSYRFAPNGVLKASVSKGSKAGNKTSVGIGAGFSW